MKNKQNDSIRASALQILLAVALISVSAMLLAATFTPRVGSIGALGNAANRTQAVRRPAVPTGTINVLPPLASPSSVSCPLAMIAATQHSKIY
jgi:hypothetical protein